MGSIIGYIVTIFFVIIFSIYDFDNLLNRGLSGFYRIDSGFIGSIIAIGVCLAYHDIFDLTTWISLWVIYIVIYTLIYFKIKKIKEKREKESERRRMRKKE